MTVSSPPMSSWCTPSSPNSGSPCRPLPTSIKPSHNALRTIPTSLCLTPCQGLGPFLLPASSSPSANNGNALPPPTELQKYAGIAPVTERSGKKSWVHWRLQCPKFLRQTFVEWAAESTRHAFWAQVYYQQQREKGKAHQAAVRALAFKWIRILYRCWQERTPYDESLYLQALKRRRAPLLHHLANVVLKRIKKTLTAPLRACVGRPVFQPIVNRMAPAISPVGMASSANPEMAPAGLSCAEYPGPQRRLSERLRDHRR